MEIEERRGEEIVCMSGILLLSAFKYTSQVTERNEKVMMKNSRSYININAIIYE